MNYFKRHIFSLLITLFAYSLSAQTWQAESASYSGTLEDGVVWFYNDDANGYVLFNISASASSSVTVYAGVHRRMGTK